MILNIILVCVIVVSLVIVLFIAIRKFPKVKTLDVSTVPAARKAEVRDRILMERMKRSSKKSREVVKKGTVPLFKAVGNISRKIFKKIYALEKKYKKEAETNVPLKAGDVKNKIRNLFDESQKLAKDEKYQEAEKIFIEIISLDPRNLDAYNGLTDIYLEMKEYQQALQTEEFVLKLERKKTKEVEKETETGQKYKVASNAHELADVYSDLGYIYQMMENEEKSAENYYKALEYERNNPKHISQMLEIYIKQGKKPQAFGLIERLEKVNPDNQKLKDYREQITGV